MSEHTPGPWRYDPAKHAIVADKIPAWWAEDWTPSFEGEEPPNTSVISTYGAMGGDDSAADIALIAAAPELLAALGALLDNLPVAGREKYQEWHRAWVATCKARSEL